MSNVIEGEAKAKIFYTCTKCGTENRPPINNKMVEENETIDVECSNCGNIKSINTKELMEEFKKQALIEMKKEISKAFKKL